MDSKFRAIVKIETQKSNSLFINFFIGVNLVFLLLSVLGYFAFGKHGFGLYIQYHLLVLALLLVPLKILSRKLERPTFFKYLFFVTYIFYICSVLAIEGRMANYGTGRFDAFTLALLLSINIFGIIYMSKEFYMTASVITLLASLIFSYRPFGYILFAPENSEVLTIFYRTAIILVVSAGGYFGLARILRISDSILTDNVNPYLDPLTGAYNRHYLEERIASVAQSKGDRQLSIINSGVDNMKEINSKYGFSAGDAILQGFANKFQSLTRHTDSVCRTEGDKLAIIVQHPSEFQVETLAERIRQAIENEKFDIIDKNNNPVEVKITASFGVVTLDEGENSDTLLSRSEKALSEAKKKGKNMVEKGA